MALWISEQVCVRNPEGRIVEGPVRPRRVLSAWRKRSKMNGSVSGPTTVPCRARAMAAVSRLASNDDVHAPGGCPCSSPHWSAGSTRLLEAPCIAQHSHAVSAISTRRLILLAEETGRTASTAVRMTAADPPVRAHQPHPTQSGASAVPARLRLRGPLPKSPSAVATITATH